MVVDIAYLYKFILKYFDIKMTAKWITAIAYKGFFWSRSQKHNIINITRPPLILIGIAEKHLLKCLPLPM